MQAGPGKRFCVVHGSSRAMLSAEFAESQLNTANVEKTVVEELYCAPCRSSEEMMRRIWPKESQPSHEPEPEHPSLMMWRTWPKECFQWRKTILEQSQEVYPAIIKERKTAAREANQKGELTDLDMGRREGWVKQRAKLLKKYPA